MYLFIYFLFIVAFRFKNSGNVQLIKHGASLCLHTPVLRCPVTAHSITGRAEPSETNIRNQVLPGADCLQAALLCAYIQFFALHVLHYTQI